MPTLVGYRHLRICGGWMLCTAEGLQMPFEREGQAPPLRICGKMSPFRTDCTVPKPPCKYCHPERRGRKPPQSKDLRIGSHILPFKPILLHGIFGCLEILYHFGNIPCPLAERGRSDREEYFDVASGEKRPLKTSHATTLRSG